MSNTINVNVRVDEELKKKTEKLLAEMGLNMTTAVNIFLRQVLRTGGIPFEITTRSEELNFKPEVLEAMEEAKRISRDPNVKKYRSFSEALEDLNL